MVPRRRLPRRWATATWYFLWSMERVGVVYGIEKIGGYNWYDIATTVVVKSAIARW